MKLDHSEQKMETKQTNFKEEWKVRYLMIPVQNSEDVVCIRCQEKMQAKSSTASRHVSRKYPTITSFSEEKKKRLVNLYESQMKNQQAVFTSSSQL